MYFGTSAVLYRSHRDQQMQFPNALAHAVESRGFLSWKEQMLACHTCRFGLVSADNYRLDVPHATPEPGSLGNRISRVAVCR